MQLHALSELVEPSDYYEGLKVFYFVTPKYGRQLS